VNLPGILLGWLLASAIGLVFHLVRGGRLGRMALYLVSAWLGFGLGHWIGEWLHIDALRVGAINLLTAVLGALLALGLTEILAPSGPPAAGGGPTGLPS
jgi:hypothetical protein